MDPLSLVGVTVSLPQRMAVSKVKYMVCIIVV